MRTKKALWLLLAASAILAFGGSSRISARTEESPRVVTTSRIAQILYHDSNFWLCKVDEDGRNPRILERDYCEVNAGDPGGANLILTVCVNFDYQQIFNRQGSGNRIPLAADNVKSWFLGYDRPNGYVYFARNFDEVKKKGDLYSVPVGGGSWILLARDAYWCDTIGDRAIIMRDGYMNQRDIMTVRYNGTQYAGIGTTNDDESYAGKFGNNVVFNRKVGGRQLDLFIAPASGGSGTALAKSFVFNELYAGSGSDRIYYYTDLGNGNVALKSVLSNGSGNTELAGHIIGFKRFLGECQSRVIFECNKNLYSVTQTNGGFVAFPTGGLLYSDHIHPYERPLIFFDRLLYAVGTSSSWTTRLCSPTNTESMDLAVKIKHDATLSWTSNRIIVQLGMAGAANNTICVYTQNGFGERVIGDEYAQNPKIYLLSTATRHIYAYQPSTTVDSWNVHSVLCDGNDDVLLATDIPGSWLHYIIAY